jgi:hypothetical protein
MTDTQLPSPEVLRKLLRYEPDTGKLFWLPRGREYFNHIRGQNAWNALYAGQEAFTYFTVYGYKQGRVFNKGYQAHRVIWAMQTGAWPKNEIDHADRDRSNNTWGNLREAVRSENCANKKSQAWSSSEFLGVCWHKHTKKWHAQIRHAGKKTSLGFFVCETEAAKTYDAAAKCLHGEFANLNFPDATIAA